MQKTATSRMKTAIVVIFGLLLSVGATVAAPFPEDVPIEERNSTRDESATTNGGPLAGNVDLFRSWLDDATEAGELDDT